MSEIQNKISELKEKYDADMNREAEIRSNFLKRESDTTCDYYVHHTRMWEYHRGKYNALIELERSLVS